MTDGPIRDVLVGEEPKPYPWDEEFSKAALDSGEILSDKALQPKAIETNTVGPDHSNHVDDYYGGAGWEKEQGTDYSDYLEGFTSEEDRDDIGQSF